MSLNAFILPALPQTPAAGLNGSPQAGSTDFKSCRPHESSAKGQSFMATLNQISNNTCDRSPESTGAENTAGISDHADTQTIIPAETNKPIDNPQAGVEDTGITEFAPAAVCINPLHACELIQPQLFNFLMSVHGSFSTAGHPDSTPAAKYSLFANLIAPHPPEGQPVQNGQVGIGTFEQLQANVSPQATNLYYFEQLTAGVFNQQNSSGTMGWEHGSWMAALSAGNLSEQTDPLGSQVNPALLHLLQIQGDAAPVQQSAAQSSGSGEQKPAANPALLHLLQIQGDAAPVQQSAAQSSGAGEQKPAANPAMIDLNGEFLLKMSAPSQQGGLEKSENAQTEVMGITPNGRFAPLAAGIQNSEMIAETAFPPETKNHPMHRLQAADRPSDQTASSKSAAEVAVAKPVEESFNPKGGAFKSQMPLTAEIVDKVTHIDGDNKDSGLLYGQDQLSEKLAKFGTTRPTSESAQRSLSSQAMHQIVQKAVLSFNNGQNEVRIDLKPEFMGHIRMQIVTDSQQIAVKILAESPFVKDMLESNLNQLKTDLQAQGLKVNELEVSVAHDSHSGNKNQTTAEKSKSNSLHGETAAGDEDSEEKMPLQADRIETMAENAIDFFA